MQPIGRRVLVAWIVVSVVLLLGLAAVVATRGRAGFYAIQGPRDVQAVEVKFLAFCIAWIYGGALVVLSQFPAFTRRHAVFLVALAILAFAYLNAVREPHRIVVGDFRAYYVAAQDMAAGRPLSHQPDTLYLYPPLLAILIRPLAHLELGVAAAAYRFLNLGSLLLFVVLLYVALLRLGVRRDVAGMLVLLSMAANVPIARTLIYLQINIHVANLVLLAMLLYPRHAWASALALTLAIHLKLYPAVFVLPFLLVRDWKWLAWFVAAQLAVVGATLLAARPDYYLQFVQRAGALQEFGIRNVSVDSFLYNTLRLAGLGDPAWRHPVATVGALALGAFIVAAGWPLLHRGVFGPRGDPADRRDPARAARGVVDSGFVVLAPAMLAVSPSIWEHHFVLVQFAMLALFTVLRTPAEWWLFLISWGLMFLVPTNEIYPVSYLRLLSLVLVGVLLRALSRRLRAGERVEPDSSVWPEVPALVGPDPRGAVTP